ncbi:MAG: hypothetical protein QXR60_05205 [Candidatus Nanoarchaeia archaeon]
MGVVISLSERKLEKLINHEASELHGCDIHKLMKYADALKSINPNNSFLHLAQGILYAKYTDPHDRSYVQSVWHLSQFINSLPYHADAVWWRLDSATSIVSGTPYTKTLSRLAKEAVKFFPENICILNAAYHAFRDGVCDYREAIKVGVRILSLYPDDYEIRSQIKVMEGLCKDERAAIKPYLVRYKKGT